MSSATSRTTPAPPNPSATPVTRADAKAWLKTFIAERFEEFGPYEDALSTLHPFINHSLLTPMLNTGLLTPADVIHAALSTKKQIPLNSLEGFIRQIIGWREFMLPDLSPHAASRCAPQIFSTTPAPARTASGRATTGIPPVDLIITRSR